MFLLYHPAKFHLQKKHLLLYWRLNILLPTLWRHACMDTRWENFLCMKLPTKRNLKKGQICGGSICDVDYHNIRDALLSADDSLLCGGKIWIWELDSTQGKLFSVGCLASKIYSISLREGYVFSGQACSSRQCCGYEFECPEKLRTITFYLWDGCQAKLLSGAIYTYTYSKTYKRMKPPNCAKRSVWLKLERRRFQM